MGRSTLITEEMRDWSESAVVGLGSLSLLEFLVDEVGDKFFSLKLREVDISASEFLIVDDLSLHEIWKSNEEGVTPWGEHLSGLAVILVEFFEKLQSLVMSLLFSEDIIEFHNEVLVGGDMCEETFWDQNTTVVLSLGSSILNEVSDSSNNIWKRFTSIGALFGNDDHIWMSLEGALKSKMRWISTHESNEIPVLNS